ncbi:nif11-like leader peptide domain protein [Synechococcus sp. A18-25c]|uniref:Nif11-like leader peptide family natural product precursor n=1 Tax=Synechococcus sp. A18-25c TaxID=1866938 RepID=UPI001644B51B|nr:Nif11-like leader peptide family natural product precursor [Synechococcus sp. A18-25c]QNJ20700.1 nif11-like leader peptide domain protein [Synechococcus sp. A18-25c]
MPEEQLKAFLEAVKADTSLQEKLKSSDNADAVVVIAKESGFSVSTDDFSKAQSALTDEELENLACGIWLSCICYDTA